MATATVTLRSDPQVVDAKHIASLRAIASFEALKGTLVLLVEVGLLSLIHKDVGEIADHIAERMHWNPEHHIPHVILEAAHHTDDAKLWALAAGAAAYIIVRFTEAYGLWHARVWAEWFALLSGTLYLPWELYELLEKQTWIRWGALLTNLAIVLWMLWLRIDACRLPGQTCDDNKDQPA